MPGVTLCDRAERGVVSCVTSRIQKIHVQILGIVNCNKSIIPTWLLLVVTNHNHPFSKVFEPQPFGSPA